MGLLDSIFGGGDNGYGIAQDNIAKNRAILDAIKLPEFAQYIPEEYQYELIKEDPALRSTQMAALNKMAGLAEDGLSAEDELAFNKARDMASQERKRATAATMENAAARGVGGSGLEFATREIANQGAVSDANNSGLQRAATRANNKVLYNTAFMDQTGKLRNQDLNVNQANTGIINRFNEMNTNNKNNAFQYNQDKQQQNYNNQMGKATGQMNLNNQSSEYAMANDALKQKRRSALMGAAGAGVGAAVGGPQGAGIGYAVGSGL